MTKNRIILCCTWFCFCMAGHSQPVHPPEASVVYPEVGNTSYYYWMIFENPAYTSCVDTHTNLPVWVSHTITKEVIEFGDPISRERPDGYNKDGRYKLLKKNAYSSSGYDHGHMAPAADFKWSAEAYETSFLMTNMAPQHGCLNQKGWCHIESHCRRWARQDADHIVYVVSGVVPGTYIDSLCINKKLKVYVPEKFYKAVLYFDLNGNDTKAIGFLVENKNLNNDEILNCTVTIDQIEALTMLDLFGFLPDEVEDEVESEEGSFDIVTTQLDCPHKGCSSIYSGNRKLPEERTKLLCE